MPKPTARFAALVFLAAANWGYVAFDIAEHAPFAAALLIATSCTIFAIIGRPRRAKN